MFFDNLGRNKRLNSHQSLDVSLRQLGESWMYDLKATSGYMIKRISVYGGCLGGQRRRRTWQPAKSAGEPATRIDPAMSEWGNPPRKRYPTLNL
jgi:hypothetical protein